MQVVIEIDENTYKDIKIGKVYTSVRDVPQESVLAIANGTPLPKGHGRLIDADRTALLSDLFCYTKYTGIDEAPYEDATKALEFAPTIIEADKAESEDKCKNCEYSRNPDYTRCHECGAKMKEGD